MPDIVEIIDDFVGKRRTVIDKIMSVQSGSATADDIAEYQKLLLAAHIDGFSSLVYPRKSARERYVRFILHFGNWADAERISLVHLAELMRRAPEPEFQKLRDEVKSRMTAFTTSPMYLSRDPHVSEIVRLWPQDKEFKEPLLGVTIDTLRHASLFYSYRCSLAHELQAPGFQWDALHLDKPYYIKSLDKLKYDWKQRYLLVYPLPFFHQMATQCLDSLAVYLKSNEINPYAFRTSGEFWLESLND